MSVMQLGEVTPLPGYQVRETMLLGPVLPPGCTWLQAVHMKQTKLLQMAIPCSQCAVPERRGQRCRGFLPSVSSPRNSGRAP